MKSYKTLLILFSNILMLTSCGGGDSSSSSSTSSSSSSSEPEPTYTSESVMQDICLNIFGSAAKDTDYFEDEDTSGYFWTAASTTETTDLLTLVNYAISCLPSYCEVVKEPYAGQWSEGDDGYFAEYKASTIAIDIGSYVYGSYGVFQIETY